jgi:tetratricopeptide (TPR) repeat protein
LDRAVLEFLAGTQRNDNQAAYVAAQRMVELAPGSEFLYKLALAAMDIQHPREALAAVKRLNTHQGWLATWGCCPGIVSRAEEWIGNYEAAIPAYERIAAADPHDGVNRQLEFTSLAALGRVHELDSILTLAEATSTEWDVPDAYSMRVGLRYRAAWALQAYGHTADARRIFRTLVDSTDAIALPEKSALPRHELRLIDRYYRALAMYYAGDLADAHAELGRIRAALTHREARGQSSPFGPDLEDVLGTMGCVATLQRDSVGVRRILVALRSFPDSEPEAQVEQARIMALTGNRDEMMRLVVSAVEHGARLGGHLLRLEFVPYRDYPPFRALIEPKG